MYYKEENMQKIQSFKNSTLSNAEFRIQISLEEINHVFNGRVLILKKIHFAFSRQAQLFQSPPEVIDYISYQQLIIHHFIRNQVMTTFKSSCIAGKVFQTSSVWFFSPILAPWLASWLHPMPWEIWEGCSSGYLSKIETSKLYVLAMFSGAPHWPFIVISQALWVL